MTQYSQNGNIHGNMLRQLPFALGLDGRDHSAWLGDGIGSGGGLGSIRQLPGGGYGNGGFPGFGIRPGIISQPGHNFFPPGGPTKQPDYSGQFEDFGETLGGYGETLGGYGEKLGGFESSLGGFGEQMSGFGSSLGGFGEQMSGFGKQMGTINEKLSSMQEGIHSLTEQFGTMQQQNQPQQNQPQQNFNPYASLFGGGMFSPYGGLSGLFRRY